MDHCAAPHLHYDPFAPFTYDRACHKTNFGCWAVHGLRDGVNAGTGQLAWDGNHYSFVHVKALACVARMEAVCYSRESPATSSQLRCMRSGLWPCVKEASCLSGKFDWKHRSHPQTHIRWLSLFCGLISHGIAHMCCHVCCHHMHLLVAVPRCHPFLTYAAVGAHTRLDVGWLVACALVVLCLWPCQRSGVHTSHRTIFAHSLSPAFLARPCSRMLPGACRSLAWQCCCS